MKQNRLTSPLVWTSILAQVLLIITLFNNEIAEPVKIIGTAIIEILTLIGVLNNPTNKKTF